MDAYGTLDRVTREHLEEARRLRDHLVDAEQAHTLAVAELKADLTRERRERQEDVRRARQRNDELARDLLTARDQLKARDASLERLTARLRALEGRARLLLTAIAQGTDGEVDAAAADLRRAL
jgi:chromosome segregation ATPase